MRKLIHLLVLASMAVAPSMAQIANSPPVPRWLSVEGTRETATLETSFEWSGKLLKAILIGASEGEMEAMINGAPAAVIEGKERATSVDVTKLIREGRNTLSLRSATPVAAMLELNGDLANTRWIATDGSWTASEGKLSVGPAADAAANPFDFKKTFDAYNSWQLAKPGNQNQATDPATIAVPPGFKIELIRSAQPGEDSWVSMTFDPQGRIILGKEKKGLMRIKVGQPARLTAKSDEQASGVLHFADKLLECRGLVFVSGDLFANANNSKGLFRLRDTDGDDQFDEQTEMLRTEGGVGHGRNHIKLGPDRKIYIAHGNNVLLPTNVSDKSPLKNYGGDQLIPNPWDGSMFDGNVELPAGHILRMNPDGTEVELIAGGLRNPLDIAFNQAGELFTFDADMERDVGTPWYMPTRVLHVVPGADFGWRRGTGRFPAAYLDTLPSVVDIGLSSPTATFFGYGARFPQKYRDAYFIMDWSYGRIIAVHLKVKGASYVGTQETFISGRPLNVTDGCIGPDGAMWFITGGRGTQSGLYRVAWMFDKVDELKAGLASSVKDAIQGAQAEDRDPAESGLFRTAEQAIRKQIELALRDPADTVAPTVHELLKHLQSEDTSLRHTSRLFLERTPVEQWRDKALSKELRAPEALLALARVGDVKSKDAILARLVEELEALGSANATRDARSNAKWAEDWLQWLRVAHVAISRLGPPEAAQQTRLLQSAEAAFPVAHDDGGAAGSVATEASQRLAPLLNRELCRTLVYLKSPHIIAKATALLRDAAASEDLLFYPFMLRYLKDGWTLEARRVCFDALNRAEKLNGASTYFKAISDTRSELAAALNVDDARTLAAVIHPPKAAALSPHALPGHTFRNWKLEDFDGKLDAVAKGRSHERARAALVSTQCVFCHRVSADASLPAGTFGPDLTQVSARFNRRDLLMHILEPSKFVDEKFRFLTITKTDGSAATGSLESEDDERVVLRPNPLAPETMEIGKAMIKERKVSEVSPMPPGLLNALKLEQILDLLAWFEAQGNASHPVFAK